MQSFFVGEVMPSKRREEEVLFKEMAMAAPSLGER